MSLEDQNSLESIIEDSINDATAEPEIIDTPVDDTTTEAPIEPDTTSEVPAPGSAETKDDEGATPADEDDFAKKFNLQAQSITGRENRIPYSRVKKIVEKNEKDVIARVTKEIEAKFSPQLIEHQTKLKDYEDRLGKVAQFEQILDNDPQQFLGMLSRHPAYKQFFDFVEQAANNLNSQPPEAKQQPFLSDADMPQPDQTLSDGSKVYSMEGLRARDEWLAKQIQSKAVQEAEARLAERYKPIEQAWLSQEQMNKIVPVVEGQIAEARTWDHFNDLEPKVVQLLKADPKISLEKAYLKAYQEYVAGERERLAADRTKVRTEVLAELKKKPIASSPGTGVKPILPKEPSGSVEDIIRASIENAGLSIDK
jgi:hypothetical protein